MWAIKACLPPIEPKTKTIHKDKKKIRESKQKEQHIKPKISMAMLRKCKKMIFIEVQKNQQQKIHTKTAKATKRKQRKRNNKHKL